MKYKKKLTRKQLLKQQDEFITLSARIAQFMREQGRSVSIGAVAILGIGALFGISHLYRAYNREQASLLEAAAQQVYHGQVMGETENQPGPANTPLFASKEELYQAARQKYQELLDKYPDTPNARRAQLYLANCAYQLGEYQQAIKLYQQYLQKYPQQDLWHQEALHGLAYAQEEAGEYSQASATFQKLIPLVLEANKLPLYMDLARTYEQAQAWELAAQTYEAMLGRAAEPEQQRLIKSKMRRLPSKQD